MVTGVATGWMFDSEIFVSCISVDGACLQTFHHILLDDFAELFHVVFR